jgi:hypothetical protein
MNQSETERLKRVEDIQEIQILHHEYMYWVNNCEWDNVIDCFTENCSADIGAWGVRKGKESLQKLFKVDIASNARPGEPRSGHFVMQPVITVNGDKAVGHWLMYILITDPKSGSLKCRQGRHDAEYQRVDGKWKIHAITWTRPWPKAPELKTK